MCLCGIQREQNRGWTPADHLTKERRNNHDRLDTSEIQTRAPGRKPGARFPAAPLPGDASGGSAAATAQDAQHLILHHGRCRHRSDADLRLWRGDASTDSEHRCHRACGCTVQKHLVDARMLTQQDYVSALFGKAHLSGSDLSPNNNPLGDGVIHTLGWDYFAGWLDGAPFPIDTTAGGVGVPGPDGLGPYACGFVPNTTDDSQ